MRCLAIVSGLAITSVLSITAYADPDCKRNYDRCNEVVVYVCSQRGLGTQDFLGGSDQGSQEQIALGKAAHAGYNTDNCRKRALRAQAH